MKSYNLLIGAMLAGILPGCATKHVTPTTNDEYVIKQIETNTRRIHTELSRLAASRQRSAPRIRNIEAPKSGPATWPITLRWSGPIEPAAELLASMIGYQFTVHGTPPVRPVLIHLDAHNRKAFDVLEDIGLQAGERIGVLFDERAKTIAVKYVAQGGKQR